MNKKLFLISLFLFSINSNISQAQTLEEKIINIEDDTDRNQSEISALQEKIDSLIQKNNFKVFGSIGLRNCIMFTDMINNPQDTLKNITGNVFQTRLSAGISGNVVDDYSYQLKILSGDSNSFNNSWYPADKNIIRLPFFMDRYFISYSPSKLNNSNNNFKFTFGKSVDFFSETELLLDEDISFNGLNQQYIFTPENNPFVKNIFLGLSENFITTEATFQNSYMLGAKAAIQSEPIENLSFRISSSFLSFPGIENLAKNSFFQGYEYVSLRNRSTSNIQFDSKFNMLDLFAKLTYKINGVFPVSISGDLVNNFGAADKNKGFLFGLNLGEIKKSGDFSINYNYKYLEQDYNLSFFVAEQMGGTGTSGSETSVSYQLAENTRFIFLNQIRKSIVDPKAKDLFIFYTTLRQDF